jgi:hypothetical protein
MLMSGITGAAGMLGGGFIGGAALTLGMKAMQEVTELASRTVGLGREEATNTEDLYRHTDTTKSFLELRDAVRASTKELGVNAQEAGRLSLMWSKVTGDADPDMIMRNVRLGAGVGRAYGIEPGAATQTLAGASNAGIDPRTFATLIGEAATKGGRSAEETSSSLLRMAQATAQTFAGKLGDNLVQAAGMMAGLNASGLPGMRNGGSEAIMTTMGSAIMQGGNAGPASAALSYLAGRRQGVTDPYDLEFVQEGGLFASPKTEGVGTSTMTNFEARLTELRRLYAGAPQNRLLNAMHNDLGLTMHQGRELLRASPADMSTTFRAISSAGINPEDMNPTSIADAVRLANASPADLEKQRQQMLGRHGQGALSDEDKTALSGAGPDGLRTALMQMAAKYGASETEGSKVREAEATLSNALTKVGADLLPVLNDVKTVEGKLVESVTGLTSTISDVYRAARGDPEAADRMMFGKAGVGGGGGERPLTDAASRQAEAKLMAFFQSQEGGGYTKEQAAGIVAQASAESGYRAHGPAGDGGHARGLMQWHEDRVAAIEAHFGKKLDDMDMLEQAKAHTWELSEGGPEAAAGKALRATTTAYGAGYAETVNDIRPSAKEMRGVARGTLAASIANNPSVSTIAPLQVIHLDQYGNMLGTQDLPVTTITPPSPWGPPRAGEVSPTPPAPPKPRLNTGQQFWGGAP